MAIRKRSIEDEMYDALDESEYIDSLESSDSADTEGYDDWKSYLSNSKENNQSKE